MAESSPVALPRWKRWTFGVLLWLPAALFGLPLVWGVADLIRLNGIRQLEIRERVANYLAEKRPIPMPWPQQLARLGPQHKRVYLFGASSVVLSDGATFNLPLQDRLRRELNSDIRIVNFGYCGVDSHAIKEAALRAMDDPGQRPHLLLFYMGHNDYANAYHHVVSASYDAFKPWLAAAWLFSGRDCTFEAYLRQLTPELMEWLQRSGLVEIDAEHNGCYNSLILERFGENTAAILKRAAELKIPTLWITPVGSLRHRPYGKRELVSAPYEQGMLEDRPERAIELLSSAREAEILSFDVRAKAPLLELLRSRQGPGVFVFDLERAWRDAGKRFGEEEFLDYFHMTAAAHQDLADRLFGFILRQEELRRALAPPAR